MADTADLRSEGKESATKGAKASRAWRVKCKNNSVCVVCGSQAVLGRATCYDCSSTQSKRTAKWGLRTNLALEGVDYKNVDPALLTVNQKAKLLDSLVKRAKSTAL